MTSPDAHAAVLRQYSDRVRQYTQEAERLAARSRLVSNLRGLSFGITVILVIAFFVGQSQPLIGAASLLGLVVFAALVWWHSRVLATEDSALRWLKVNRDAEARVQGRWREFPEDGAGFGDPAHPYSGDLDLFGPNSLFQRINVAHTHFGQRALASLLTSQADARQVARRQQAVMVLSSELDARHELEALSLATAPPLDAPQKRQRPRAQGPDPETLLAWATSEPMLSHRRGLVWTARVMPLLLLAAIAVTVLAELRMWVWLLPLTAQVIVVNSVREQAARVFHAVSSSQGVFLRFGPMLRVLESLKSNVPLIQELKQRIATSEKSAIDSMREFERAVSWFELRHNGLVHPFVNAALLWDLHCMLRLEAWQQSAGRFARDWFEVVGELEALSSLASLAHDEPTFCFPTVVEGATAFDARDLAHPLLDRGTRVANDVTLDDKTRALLVTGSNMSGKSTLLRSMGVAQVMALAGAPVCASSLTVSAFHVRTSMRVSDSLEQGVSHFYAELRKLREVVLTARASGPVLFLLDEILHGTNSEERQIGARWILRELLKLGALGAVSTHDTGLCQLPDELMKHVAQVHFRESVSGDAMTFDYRLRAGPVAGGNALRLMRSIGLEVPLPEANTVAQQARPSRT